MTDDKLLSGGRGATAMCESVREAYVQLLREWLDALLSCIVTDPRHPSLDGAVLCPACSHIHGRCHEAVYPLMAMTDMTGDAKYLDAAGKLFKWSSVMLCDDGSLYNDSQSDWNGTTVFAALSLHKGLMYHGHLLNADEKAAWEGRLLRMGLWLMDGISPERKCNINYIAANAAAMARIGLYFDREAMLERARELADFSLRCVTGQGLVFGEGSLKRNATPRGGCAVDIGYNVEETLPALYEYAEAMRDENAMAVVRKAARAHLDLMLPDGAWDDSFGSRNFKWTYWGSRTADGCQAMLNALGKSEPVFAEAAYRNLLLLKSCTDGLLSGGPYYRRHGELPCVHHAFCHAKVLAQALDEGIAEFSRTSLPSDDPERVAYYPEAGTFRISCGDWRMTVCAGDFPYMKGGHASGGAVTLLWHRAYGPVIAAANTDHSLREPLNQQLTRRKKLQGSVCPRLEREENGIVFSQVYDLSASVTAEEHPDRIIIRVEGRLCDVFHQPYDGGGEYALTYELSGEGLCVKGRCTYGAKAGTLFYYLPVICPTYLQPAVSGESALIGGRLRITSSAAVECPGPVFSLAPGFEAVNLRILPGDDGTFLFSVAYDETQPS